LRRGCSTSAVANAGFARHALWTRAEKVNRYYFHVRADGELIRDDKGLELSCPEDLNRERLKAIAKSIADDEFPNETRSDYEFEVFDQSGYLVFVLPFKV
jgi:hypothetical protein